MTVKSVETAGAPAENELIFVFAMLVRPFYDKEGRVVFLKNKIRVILHQNKRRRQHLSRVCALPDELQ